MTSERKLLHSIDIAVRWADMDAVGHVNNATYFTYFESIRIHWYQSIGLSRYTGNQNEGPVLVSTKCVYHKEIVHPATVLVTMYGGPPRRSSYDSFYELRDATQDSVLYAEAQATSVWVDHSVGKSKPMPDELRNILSVN